MGQIQSLMLLTFVVPIYPKLTVSERLYLEIFIYQRLPKGITWIFLYTNVYPKERKV